MKRLQYIGILVINIFLANTVAECVPAHEYFPMKGKWPKNDQGEIVLGMYARMSPDGKHILRSFSGSGLSQVTLLELVKGPTNEVKVYETPMSNEAFPVQGTWRYLVDIGGQHYLMDDIKLKERKAEKQFTGGIKGFYTVASELAGGTNEKHQLRSLSWPNERSDDSSPGGVGVLTNQIITVSQNDKKQATKLSSSKVFSMCKNLRKTDGDIMSLPMMSPYGDEFSSMPQNPKKSSPSMRIYRFGNDHQECIPTVDLDIAVAKVTFSYPNSIDAILFYSSGSVSGRGNGVSFFERATKKIFSLDDPNKRVRADSYPGFTKDGRILYGAYWEECDQNNVCKDEAGYVLSDPFQNEEMKLFKKNYPELAKNFKECITKE